MLQIDGSSGGGSVIRLALALSSITGKEFSVTNIRASRPNPGLAMQHLMAVNAFARISNAKVVGNTKGSRELTFSPGTIQKNKLFIDVQTAGSLSLIIEALLPWFVATKQPLDLELIGGTNVPWSPPVDTLQLVLFPLLYKYGTFTATIGRRGFYPKGKGQVRFSYRPGEQIPYRAIRLTKKQELHHVKGILITTEKDLRFATAIHSALSQVHETSDLETLQVTAASEGTQLILLAYYGDDTGYDPFRPMILSADCLLEKNPEQTTQETIARFKTLLSSAACVDEQTADQLLPYLGLFGGELITTELTNHLTIACELLSLFLEIDISAQQGKILVKEGFIEKEAKKQPL
ncbi:MAG: RNA 3'-terminal phosphate cyclase [Candidatus Woesearchaeota archaeon]|nr:MAG: RNA 3'-terminal phosphate cyclase [Candidatus Woesearchaeota archaeon]